MSKSHGSWSRRKGVEFEREVQRRLAEVFGRALVRRGVKARGRHAPADVVTPGFWIECKSQRRANPRAALRQAAGGAVAEGRWAVAVCKDDGKPPQVTMSFEDFVALLRDWHELRLQRR
ncbi:MAG TPA: hypothetical protein VGL81_23985 [Polyangiaceae bacterium]|jgi:hypothetical protein